ncbi:NlpC/P60 family protein [Roseibium sp. RKSG952]|uniref:NlpC/P60 family protein n=1 Tax=Roseibium sp. RKSG952 TaxID=2529384 RepID=UPI0012BCDA40|nr:NlpC/P60 family protein [Roseibium sp. RKSG952]MTH96079.1 peptidase P60 [Roseibium sp. RKSG952]
MVAPVFEPDIAGAVPQRLRLVEEARRWLGTPYRHQASVRGAGCDCLGLIRGVWRAVIGPEPQALPPYSADWAETGNRETLLEAGRRWFVERAPAQAAAGDVLVFRWAPAAAAKHAGILGPGGMLIHAYDRAGVIESPLAPAWQRRVVAAFSFPEVPLWQP